MGIEVHVNEISERRLQILREQGFENITEIDALQMKDQIAFTNPGFQPTVVVMNPPFSSNMATGGQSEMIGANMVREALDMLAPGGRLVAIVSGGHPGYEDSVGMGFEGSQQMRAWWDDIFGGDQFDVKANVHVDGQIYAKFGTHYDTRLLVIDKKAEGDTSWSDLPVQAEVTEVKELARILRGIRNERISTSSESNQVVEQASTQPQNQRNTGADDGRRTGTRGPVSETAPSAPARAAADGVGAGSPGDQSDARGGTVRAGASRTGTGEDDGPVPDESQAGDGVSTESRGGRRRSGGGVRDGDIPQGSRAVPTGQPAQDNQGGVVRPGDNTLEASEGTYTPIAEEHLPGTPLVRSTAFALTHAPDASHVEVNIPNPDQISPAEKVCGY